MKDFDFPSFFIDRLQSLAITIKITAYQIENTFTAVFVFKDLPEKQDRKVYSCDLAFDRFFLREINGIYAL